MIFPDFILEIQLLIKILSVLNSKEIEIELYILHHLEDYKGKWVFSHVRNLIILEID